MESLCDTINDCTDGSDETVCRGWKTVSRTSLFEPVLTNASRFINVSSNDDCKRQAIVLAALAYAYRAVDQTCYVYVNKSRIIDGLNNPGGFLTGDPDSELVIQISNPDLYRQCSADLHCSGRGSLLTANFDEELNACPCRCDTGWVGHRCDIPLSISQVSSYVAVIGRQNRDRPWVKAQFHAAISFNRTDIQLSSDIPERFNDTHLGVQFQATGTLVSVTSYQQRIFRSEQWQLISDALLARLLPDIAFISGTTTPTQQREVACTQSNNAVVCLADESVSSPTRRFKVDADANIAPYEIRYTFRKFTGPVSATRRQTGANTTGPLETGVIRCDANSTETTIVSVGCVRTVCTPSLPDPSIVESISIVPLNASVQADETCGATSVAEVKSSLLFNTSIDDSLVVVNTPKSNALFQYGISIVIISAVILILLLIAARTVHVLHEKKVEKMYQDTIRDKLDNAGAKPHWSVRIAARDIFYQQQALRFVSFHLILALLFSVLCLTGGYAWVVHDSRPPLDTNVDVVMEQYMDRDCQDSPYAFLPTVVGRIHGDDECRFMTSVGGDATRLYTKAQCTRNINNGGGSVEITMQETFGACRSAEKLTFPLDVCVPKNFLFVDNSNSQFIRLRCLSTDTAVRLMESLARLSPLPDFNSSVRVLPFSSRVPRPIVVTSSGGTSTYPFLLGSNVIFSTSNFPNRLASMESYRSYIGDFNRYALVYQQPSSLTTQPNLRIAHIIETIIAEDQAILHTRPQVNQYIPEDPDYPVGFVFNFFNTADEVRGAFPFTAHRYPNMQGSVFDLGMLFNSVEHDREGEGVTLSFWLRATERSEGWVLGLTDFYQTTANANPILEFASTLINTGRDTSTHWFQSDFHLYYGVYLDGPGRILRLVIADPRDEVLPGTEPLVAAEWRLAEIGQEALLNDQWHQIRILVYNLNYKVNAQLAIDGVTAYGNGPTTGAGWTICLDDRRFTPIRNLDDTVLVNDAGGDVVYQGGVLVVGYFNGGVQGVEVVNYPIPRGSLSANGVEALRDEARFGAADVTAYVILAWILVACAIIMVFGALATFISLRRISRHEHQALVDVNDEAYRQVIWSTHFKNKYGYNRLPFHVALELLNLNGNEFMVMLEDLNRTSKNVRENLVRLLWRAKAVESCREKMQAGALNWLKYQYEEVSRDVPDLISETEREAAQLEGLQVIHNRRRYKDVAGIIETLPMPTSDEWNLYVHQVQQEAVKRTVGRRPSVYDTQMKAASLRQSRGLGENFDSGVFDAGEEYTNEYHGIRTGLKTRRVIRLVMVPSFGNLVEATLHVLQGVAVYAAVMQFPLGYSLSLGKAFQFVSLDYSHTFDLPQTVTPIMQFIISIIIVVMFAYVCIIDDRKFLSNLSKYARLRDLHDAPNQFDHDSVKKRCLGLETLLSQPSDVEALVHLFSPLDRLKIDRFVHNLDVHDRPKPAVDPNETLIVKTHDRMKVILYRSTNGKSVIMRKEKHAVDPPAPLVDKHSHPLEILGVYCPCHDRLLTPDLQNDVYPFTNRRTCSAVEGGVPCNRSIGTMHVCNKKTWDGQKKFDYVCDYALCERHWRPSPSQMLMSRIMRIWRMSDTQGVVYLMTRALVLSVTSFYTPFMRTVLMVVSCHPFYRCSFGKCWETIEPIFAISAYVTLVTLFLFGFCLPVMCIVVLCRRYFYLRKAFKANDQDSPYMDEDGGFDLVQWTRFLTSDDSAMSVLYNQLLPNRMFFMPFFLLFKMVLLLPAVLIEPNTSEQMIGIACVEIAFGIFTLVTSPYMSPWVDFFNRVGSAHQLILLAFLCFYAVGEVAHESIDTNSAMLTFSSIYIVFVITCFVLISIEPIVTRMLFERRRFMILNYFGIAPAALTLMYTAGIKGSAVEKAKPAFEDLTMVEDEEVQKNKIRALETLSANRQSQLAAFVNSSGSSSTVSSRRQSVDATAEPNIATNEPYSAPPADPAVAPLGIAPFNRSRRKSASVPQLNVGSLHQRSDSMVSASELSDDDQDAFWDRAVTPGFGGTRSLWNAATQRRYAADSTPAEVSFHGHTPAPFAFPSLQPLGQAQAGGQSPSARPPHGATHDDDDRLSVDSDSVHFTVPAAGANEPYAAGQV